MKSFQESPQGVEYRGNRTPGLCVSAIWRQRLYLTILQRGEGRRFGLLPLDGGGRNSNFSHSLLSRFTGRSRSEVLRRYEIESNSRGFRTKEHILFSIKRRPSFDVITKLILLKSPLQKSFSALKTGKRFMSPNFRWNLPIEVVLVFVVTLFIIRDFRIPYLFSN